MRKTMLLFLLALVILASGCKSGMKRVGYALPESANSGKLAKCPIVIQCNAQYDSNNVVVLGSINAFDTGFSTTCDEAYVLDIFAKEACALGADLINIKMEKQPDFWSTCYRAKAEFIRFNDREFAKTIGSDQKFTPELIIDRSVKSKERTREVLAASVGGGLLGGIIVYQLTAPHQ